MTSPGNQAPLLAVEGLSVFYDQFRAVDGIDLSVSAGEVVSIIGANGAGKSSLLKAIIGQADRIEGTIRYEGGDLAGHTTAEIAARGIALVPEGRRLFPKLTVVENLMLGAFRPAARSAIDRNLALAFDTFPVLKERRSQLAGTMSGGQQQMLAIARALMSSDRKSVV